MILGSIVALEIKDILSSIVAVGVVGLAVSTAFLILQAPEKTPVDGAVAQARAWPGVESAARDGDKPVIRSELLIAIFLTFARACLDRDMTIRANFILESQTSLGWMSMNLAFYLLVFTFTSEIGKGTGWSKEPFFAFVATGLIINSIVQALFMPSAEELTEMVRTGGLDAVLVQPLDAQFMLSMHRVDFSSFANGLVGVGLLGWAVSRMDHVPSPVAWLLYPLLIFCGVAILYSLIIMLAAATILLGRNQSLYDFWFYITNFSRYPAEIYSGPWGGPLRTLCTFVIPILLVVNVPARAIAMPLSGESWGLIAAALIAASASLVISRLVFQAALAKYRSASS
jgi:ABC-2 type transport system permease protein